MASSLAATMRGSAMVAGRRGVLRAQQAAAAPAVLRVQVLARVLSTPASTSTAGASPTVSARIAPGADVRLLYDGDCPLCMREVDFLRGRDSGKGKIDFVDISSPSYRAEDNAGITYEQAMERIHAIKASGDVITGIEVFRTLYEAVGLGFVYAITTNPVVGRMADAAYDLWAKNRMALTGREAMEIMFERRRQAMSKQGEIPGSMCGDEDAACELPPPRPKQQQPAAPKAEQQA